MKKINWKKELRLLPGYLIVGIWVLFTAVMLFWILGASLSTSRDIYQGNIFKFETGLHFENYATAWNVQNVSVFFGNSLLYSVISCVGVLAISAPAAYVLSRWEFTGGKALREKQTSHGVRGNAFMAIVTDIETGLKSALVRLNTLSGLPLASLCPMNEFISADPAPGQTLWAFIDPGMIFISRHAGSPDFANYFSGKLCSFRQDPVEGLLGLALADGALLEARIGNLELPDPAPENGERLFARFSARAVAICAN